MKAILNGLKRECRNTKKYRAESFMLGIILIRLDPKEDRQQIKLIKRRIKALKDLSRGAVKNLKTNVKSINAAIAYLHRYDLTPKEKKYWTKFRNQVTSKWNTNDPDAVCRRIAEFLQRNKRTKK